MDAESNAVLGMILADPVLDVCPKLLGQAAHAVRFKIGDRVRLLVVGYVSLLSKGIERLDRRGVRAEGQCEGFDNTVVMIRAFGLVPGDSQGRRCKLERGVVRDVEAPIVVKTERLRGPQVAISYGEEIGDFLPARLVLLEPPEFEPIL
jgi:hypothetical protein